jgi:hypothetical protein
MVQVPEWVTILGLFLTGLFEGLTILCDTSNQGSGPMQTI